MLLGRLWCQRRDIPYRDSWQARITTKRTSLLSQWEGKLLTAKTWRGNYNTYLRRSSLSRSSVAAAAESAGRSLFQGGRTKYASIVENSFRMFALILVIFIQAGKQ